DGGAGVARAVGFVLKARPTPTKNERGEPVVDASFYVMFNAHHEPLDFTLPEAKWGDLWGVVLDTTAGEAHYMREEDIGGAYKAGESMAVQAWSLVLLRRIDKAPDPAQPTPASD